MVADEESDQSGAVLEEIKKYSFPWTFVRFDQSAFENATGLRKFWNSPSACYNAGLLHLSPGSDKVALMGNEIVPWADCWERLLEGLPPGPHSWVASATYDVPPEVSVDEYGADLTQAHVDRVKGRLLSTQDQPNLLSLFTRAMFEEVGGFDCRYLAGVGAEDADLVRRMRLLPGYAHRKEEGAVSLHFDHGGVSHLRRPDPSVISEGRLAEGVAINRRLYQSWTGERKPPVVYDVSLGVKEVFKVGGNQR